MILSVLLQYFRDPPRNTQTPILIHQGVRYRGLEKNANHLFAVFVLVNIVLAKRQLLRLSQA